MQASLVSDNINNNYLNLELYNKTLEANFKLDSSVERIREILSITQDAQVNNQYIYKAPIINYGKSTTGYKIKLLVNLTTNIEFTEQSEKSQTKFTSKEQLYNLAINLPEAYEDGMNIKITPSVVHVSYKMITESTLYVSSFLTFAVTV